jgi:glutathione peroxidase
MASLKGKKVMIVNTASECGLTPQYENLEKLNKEYGGDKFVIIGFPCNDFGAQEPGTNEEIKTFCTKNYGVSFQMMDKVDVLGDDKCELYQWLTDASQNGVESTVVKWNFQKYLIDEDGKYFKMISPKTLPDDPEIVKWIKGN